MAHGKLGSLPLATMHWWHYCVQMWRTQLKMHRERRVFSCMDSEQLLCITFVHKDTCNIYIFPSSLPAFLQCGSVNILYFSGNKATLITKNTRGPSDKKPLPPHTASESHICLSEVINPKTFMEAGFSR